MHESDKLVKAAVSKKAAAAGIKAVFTTSQREKHSSDWSFIHPALPARVLRQNIPRDVSVFIDFSTGAGVTEAFAGILPSHCITITASKFIGNDLYLRPGASIRDAKSVLEAAWQDATNFSISLDSTDAISLADVSKYSAVGSPLTAVDWTVPTVPIRICSVDENKIFRSDKTYLLVGLSGEVGQSLAAWMVDHGARHVVLTSRKPVIDPDFLNSLEKKGADVRGMSLDITSKESLMKCLNVISRTMPEIGGVANGALIVADMRFDQMQLEDVNKVLRPKVDGSRLLDEVFHDTPLDFFIMFSSLTTSLGNMGQSNYAAANMYMSTLALQRRRRGVAASVIELSSLMGIGHVGRSEVFDAEYFRSLGATNVSEIDVHTIFAEAIAVGKPGSSENLEIITGMSPLYFDELDQLKAAYRRDIKFSHFVLARSGAQASDDSSATVSVKSQLKTSKSVAQVNKFLLGKFCSNSKIPERQHTNIIQNHSSSVSRRSSRFLLMRSSIRRRNLLNVV